MIRRTMHVLAVQDLQASLRFYRDVLGFAIKEIGDEGWRLFERDGCQIMVGHCPDSKSARDLGDHSYFAYIVVDNVDEYYAEVVGNGVELIKELRSELWGMREFGLRTNDGHRIMVGQDLEA
mgnify:CR=1 FL=1